MGSGTWSNDHFNTASSARAAAGGAFAYTRKMATAAPTDRKVHDFLNPLNVKFRESCDSDEHPLSRAIAVCFDVTGSMGRIPRVLQTKLIGLLAMLLSKGYVQDPQIMFAGVGDATCDFAPLQVSQFESDNRMDEHLNNLYLEGGGGGQVTESYELAMYWFARHTKIDCWLKRKDRGYLFLIGDESYYPMVKRDEVRKVIGDTLQEDIPVAKIVIELQEMYDVYMIRPLNAAHGTDDRVRRSWVELLGENVIQVEDMDTICEVIAGRIGLAEGVRDLDGVMADLKDAGLTAGHDSVRNALVPFAKGALATSTVEGALEKSDTATGVEAV